MNDSTVDSRLIVTVNFAPLEHRILTLTPSPAALDSVASSTAASPPPIVSLPKTGGLSTSYTENENEIPKKRQNLDNKVDQERFRNLSPVRPEPDCDFRVRERIRGRALCGECLK